MFELAEKRFSGLKQPSATAFRSGPRALILLGDGPGAALLLNMFRKRPVPTAPECGGNFQEPVGRNFIAPTGRFLIADFRNFL